MKTITKSKTEKQVELVGKVFTVIASIAGAYVVIYYGGLQILNNW